MLVIRMVGLLVRWWRGRGRGRRRGREKGIGRRVGREYRVASENSFHTGIFLSSREVTLLSIRSKTRYVLETFKNELGGDM